MKNILFMGILCLLISCSVDRQEEDSRNLIPRSELLARPDRFYVKMNRAGDKISYISRCKRDGALYLNVADLDGKVIVSVKVKMARDLSDYRWALTGDHILYPQDTNGDENNQVHCLNIQTGEVKDITPFPGVKAEILRLSKKYPHEILIGLNKELPQWYDLYRLNILTGEMRLAYRNREFSSYFLSEAPCILCDDDFNVKLGRKTLEDGSVEYRIMKNSKWRLWQKIPFEDTKTTKFLVLSRDGKRAYKRDSIGRNLVSLAEQDLQTGESKIIFEHAEADVGYETLFDEDKCPQVVAIKYLKTKLYGLNAAAQRTVDQMKKNASGKEVHILDSNSKNSIWLICLTSDVKSTEYFVCSRNVKSGEILSFKKLFSAQPRLDKHKLYSMEPVVIKSGIAL